MSYRKHALMVLTIVLALVVISSNAMAQDNEAQSGILPWTDMIGSESSEAVQSAMEHGLAVRQARPSGRLSTRSPKKGALTGKRISLSPGHGIQRVSGGWDWQRGITVNLREDKHTYEWVNDYVRPMLERAGSDILMMRAYSYTETTTIIKNTDSNYAETGTWAKSSSGDYRYANGDSTETATATWSFNVAKDGYYPVYVRYYTSDNRVPDAQYTIVHARGESVVFQNQSMKFVNDGTANTITQNTKKDSANVWRFLGMFPFKASEKGVVRLSNVTSSADKVVIADAVQIGDGPGTIVYKGSKSGQYKWQESALAWLEYMGIPSWVLDGGDVSGRSLYSLYEGVDASLSLHSNAFNGGSRGTQTYVWYPLNSAGDLQWVQEPQWDPGHADNNLPPGTYNYAKHINQRFLDYLRKYVDSGWKGTSNLYAAGFGELRPVRNAWYNNKSNSPLIIPVLLIETAFHDNETDGRYIRETNTRFWGARGIMTGIIQHFKGDDAQIPPLPPNKLTVTAEGDHLNLTWEPVQDQVITNSAPTKYYIYTSDDGLLFDVEPLLTVDENKATLPIAHGQTLYVRITAVNDAGESLDSLVGVGRLPNQNQKKILYIDGADREMKSAYDPNNVRSYARIYGPAILFNNAGYGIDSVDDEGAAELLKTHQYDLVVWATGQTSVTLDVLTAEQRTLIEQLRANKTPLLISGSDIGFAMADSSYNSDASWLANTFNAKYMADEAYNSIKATQKISAPNIMSGEVIYSGCIVNGGSTAALTEDAACVLYPDVLESSGGTAILNYIGGDVSASTGAGILSSDGKAILVAFPLETVIDSKQRLCLIANLMAKLLGTTNNDSCTAATWTPDPEICDNKLDDDGNGKIDCEDEACASADACQSKPVSEICDNDVDDDGNGKTDCDDDACAGSAVCQSNPSSEICGNELDDDGNGKTDCDDEACANTVACQSNPTSEICGNELDDDGNGKTDCEDEACASTEACQSSGPGENPGPGDNPGPGEDPVEDPENPSDGSGSLTYVGGESDCSMQTRNSDVPGLAFLMGLLGCVVLRRRRRV